MGDISITPAIVVALLLVLSAEWHPQSPKVRRGFGIVTMLVAGLATILGLFSVFDRPITLPIDPSIVRPINLTLGALLGIGVFGSALHRFITDYRAATAKRLAAEGKGAAAAGG